MSDIEIVTADSFRNGWRSEGVVPYGTVFVDETNDSEDHSFEGIQDGAVLAVDWRGVDQVDTEIGSAKRKPGRPKGSKSKVV